MKGLANYRVYVEILFDMCDDDFTYQLKSAQTLKAYYYKLSSIAIPDLIMWSAHDPEMIAIGACPSHGTTLNMTPWKTK